MTSLDVGIAALRSGLTAERSAAGRFYDLYDRSSVVLKSFMPKGLYGRALLIIIAPMVVLQSVVAFMFMERHWSQVTHRLSAGVVEDIATLIEVYRVYPQDAGSAQLRRIAQEKLGLVVDFLPVDDLPPPGPKPFFSLVDHAISEELRKQIGRPFWIDTVGRSALVESRQARQCGDARIRAAPPPLRRTPYLSRLDGRHLTGADRGAVLLRNQMLIWLADAAKLQRP